MRLIKSRKRLAENFKPEVSVSTTSSNGSVVIAVKDNGVGIPDNIKKKKIHAAILSLPSQPAKGTGLGLSLTYDMVVKVGMGGVLT